MAMKIYECRKKMRRLRLKWLEDVDNYLGELKVKRWREKASNRELWSCHKGGQGSQSQGVNYVQASCQNDKL
jgi:hypothetical protein